MYLLLKQVRSQVNIVVSEEVKSSSPTKGFTLKLSRPTTPVTVTKDEDPDKFPQLPTGLVSQNFETRVKDGVTTVHETKIIGTYIGSQYARVLESSSSVLPFVVTASRAPTTTTLAPKTPPPTTPEPPATSTTPRKPVIVQALVPENAEIHTERSVVSSSDLENDERFSKEPMRIPAAALHIFTSTLCTWNMTKHDSSQVPNLNSIFKSAYLFMK